MSASSESASAAAAALDTSASSKMLPTIAPEEIEIRDVLKDGSYGLVYTGVCRSVNVCIKVPKVAELTPEKLALFHEEVKTMAKLFHPNIALFLGVCVDKSKKLGHELLLVVERLEQDLQEFLLTSPSLSLFERVKIAREVAQGVAALHSIHMLHRDLKTTNVLLDKHGVAKLCDFGLSHIIDKSKLYTDPTDNPKGTPLYFAPEVFLGGAVSTAVDVYAFGIVLWEILTSHVPFPQYDEYGAIKAAVCTRDERPDVSVVPKACPPSLVALMQRCWAAEPARRPAIGAIVAELKDILLHTVCHSNDARRFWGAHYITDEAVTEKTTFESFSQNLYEFCDEEYPWHLLLADGETRVEPLSDKDEAEQQRLTCLQRIFDPNASGFVYVADFGRLEQWFGPCTKESAAVSSSSVRAATTTTVATDSPPQVTDGLNIVERIYAILGASLSPAQDGSATPARVSSSNHWFVGELSQADAGARLGEGEMREGMFLVRFSSTPSLFTVSRVVVTSNGPVIAHKKLEKRRDAVSGRTLWFAQGLQASADNFVQFVHVVAKELNLSASPMSPYQSIFQKRTVTSVGYD